MNAYDFDKTIYNGDSSLDFYFYCIRNYPKIIIYFPVIISGIFLFVIGINNKTKLKEKFYSFLNSLNHVDKVIDNFWKENENKIKQWYLDKKMPSDLIISASPEFLLEPICKKLNVNLIASKIDKKTGKYHGENCYGKEKVKRFSHKFGVCTIENFYSDSLSDAPLAEYSQNSFMVKKNNIIKWEDYKPSGFEQFMNFIFSKVFTL